MDENTTVILIIDLDLEKFSFSFSFLQTGSPHFGFWENWHKWKIVQKELKDSYINIIHKTQICISTESPVYK